MKTFQLEAEPRIVLGKKASKALRNDSKIPVVLNGGKIVDLPYDGKLAEGEKDSMPFPFHRMWLLYRFHVVDYVSFLP